MRCRLFIRLQACWCSPSSRSPQFCLVPSLTFSSAKSHSLCLLPALGLSSGYSSRFSPPPLTVVYTLPHLLGPLVSCPLLVGVLITSLGLFQAYFLQGAFSFNVLLGLCPGLPLLPVDALAKLAHLCNHYPPSEFLPPRAPEGRVRVPGPGPGKHLHP